MTEPDTPLISDFLEKQLCELEKLSLDDVKEVYDVKFIHVMFKAMISTIIDITKKLEL